MSKQYNLSTTEDNGQSVTTSQTVTEHPEEILRLMKLAGLENAQVVAEDDSVFEPTPANDKLDLDDYSKKSPESIAKQKKTIQPTLGDNPLEYSLDENEIYEAMMEEFDESEEVNEELTAGQKKLPAGLQKAILAKQGKKDEAVEETDEESTEEVADIQEGVGLSGGTSTPYDNYDDRVQRLAREKDKANLEKPPAVKQVPKIIGGATGGLLKPKGFKSSKRIPKRPIDKRPQPNTKVPLQHKRIGEDFEVDPDSVGYDDHIQRLARKKGNMSTKDMIDAGIPVHQQKVVHVSTDDDDSSNNPYKDEKGPVKMRKAVLTNDFDESNEDQDRMAKLAGLNERGATRPMNFAGTKDHRIKGDTSKSGPEVDTLKHVDKIQKLAWNKAKAKPSWGDPSGKEAKIDIIMPKKRDTVAIKGDLTKASPHAKASKIDIKGDSSKANPNAKEPKIGIKGDSSKSKLRGEDLERLKKLAGIQEDGSEKRPSRLPHPDIDPGDQSFDWPNSGPDMTYIDPIQKLAKKGKTSKAGTYGHYSRVTKNPDGTGDRLGGAYDSVPHDPHSTDTTDGTGKKKTGKLDFKARVGF